MIIKNRFFFFSLVSLLVLSYPFSPLLVISGGLSPVGFSSGSILNPQGSPELSTAVIYSDGGNGLSASPSDRTIISANETELQAEQDFIAKSLSSLNRPVEEILALAKTATLAQEKNPTVLHQAFMLLSLAYPAAKNINIDNYSVPAQGAVEIESFYYEESYAPVGISAITTTWIAFASNRDGNYEIYRMAGNGSNVSQLTSNSADDWQPAFSPNSLKIAFSSIRDGQWEIYVMDWNGANQQRLTVTPAGKWNWWPAWSPDSSKIAFISTNTPDGSPHLMTMNANGTGITRVTNSSGWEALPSWTANGDTIAFTGVLNGSPQVFKVPATGGVPVLLTSSTSWNFYPNFSPDGTKIAFTSNRDGNYEIYRMNGDGSSPTRLTSNTFWDFKPSYSPNGAQIAFVSDRDGNKEIYKMDQDGTTPIRLTTVSFDDMDPSWTLMLDISPPTLPSLISPANGSTIVVPVGVPLATVDFSWSASSDDTTPVSYDFRVALDINLTNLVISNNNLGVTATTAFLPVGAYFWSVRAKDSAVPQNIGAFVTPAFSFAVSTSITFTTGFPTGWNMFSMPVNPSPASSTVTYQLGDDGITTVYHYNPVTKVYDPVTVLGPGTGYWTRVSSLITVDFEGPPLTTATAAVLLGNNAWNQIGYPYIATGTWGNSFIRQGSTTLSIAAAAAASWINSTIYYYNPVTKGYVPVLPAGDIVASKAYWLRTLTTGLTLIVPAP